MKVANSETVNLFPEQKWNRSGNFSLWSRWTLSYTITNAMRKRENSSIFFFLKSNSWPILIVINNLRWQEIHHQLTHVIAWVEIPRVNDKIVSLKYLTDEEWTYNLFCNNTHYGISYSYNFIKNNKIDKFDCICIYIQRYYVCMC